MTSMKPINCLTFRAAAAIPKGSAVKVDATGKIVTKASAATDKTIGIAQTSGVTTAGDKVEVAMSGGGGKGLAGGAISAGDLLTADTNGALIATTSANNRVVGIALEDAVENDLFSVDVQLSNV